MAKTGTNTLPRTPEQTQSKGRFARFWAAVRAWLWRNKAYFVAFAIPALLTYLAYAIFGLYPFGEQSVLCLDLNGQYVYYFEALRDAFWGDGSIFYSWSRNLSGGFMGIIGYYLASPFTLIVILLPEDFMLSSLLIMQLCKLGSAGVTFSYFLRKSKGVEEWPSLIFSTMYAMMAYAIIQLIDPMWLDGLVFLPLIMLGIEYLVDDGRRLNYIIPLALMCVANFYIGYMICLFVILYFFFYLIFGTEQRHRKAMDFLKPFCRIAYSSVVALACAAFMLLPVVSALSLGKFDFTDPDYSFRFQSLPLSEELLEDTDAHPVLTLLLDLVDMLPQLLPAQYDSVNVQGKPEIYCGLLTVVLLPMFYMNKNIDKRKKVGYSLLIAIMVTCMMIVPIDMLWHGGQVPNWLPFRYSFMLSFILLTMAAVTFANRDAIRGKHILISAIILAVYMAVVIGMDFDQMAEGAVWISAAAMGLYLIILYFLCCSNATRNKKNVSIALTVSLLVMTGAEATYNAVDSMQDIDEEVAYSTRDSYQNYIQNGKAVVEALEEYDDGLYRSEKTFYRTVNDNAAFGLKGISHSSSVMNTRIIDFIETLGYDTHSYYTRYDGNTTLADSILGIKYVLDRGDESDSSRLNEAYEPVMTYDYVDQDGEDTTITVYENPYALSIGYMVDEDVLNIDHLGNDNPFNSQNIFMSTMAGQTTFDDSGNFESWHEYYTEVDLAEDMVISDAITTSDYGDQTKFEVTGDGDPTVDFHIEITEENAGQPIYIYFKTEYQNEVNLYLYSWTEEEWDAAEEEWSEENSGVFTWENADLSAYGEFDSLGAYFEGDNYTIRYIGTFEEGTKLTLRMTVSDEFTIVKDFQFYAFDYDLFEEDIAILQENQWEITEYNDRMVEGTITAEEGQIMMTTIPYEPGWTIEVDGEEVEVLFEETESEDGGVTDITNLDGDVGTVVVVDAMIGLRLTEGTHTITMTYTPPGWWIGIALLCAGVVCIVIIWFSDRKRYAVMIARVQRQQEEEEKRRKKLARQLRSEKKPQVEAQPSQETLMHQLISLHDQGLLTDREFEEKKRTLEKQEAKEKKRREKEQAKAQKSAEAEAPPDEKDAGENPPETEDAASQDKDSAS